MKSKTLFTMEIDDVELAMEELTSQLKNSGLKLMKNTCGIAFCDKDTDLEEFIKALEDNFDFPIMGCTALAIMTKAEGYQTSGISVLVLTSDDCQFHMQMTESLSNETNAEEEIKKTYQELAGGLPEKEKLILAYGSKLFQRGGDVYVDYLTELSGGVPVYGALASDDFTFKGFHTFCKGKLQRVGLAMLLITGNVNPIFKAEFSLDHLTEFSAEITSSKGADVFTLDGKPLLDSLKNFGLETKQTNGDNVIMEFIGTPFLVSENQANGEKVRRLRNLTRLDFQKGSGGFLGDMPQGATMHVGLMRKEDVQNTVALAFQNVLDQIKESGLEYSTLLCSSCGSRYLILATEPDAEARAYQGLLPEEIELMGFYSYGEICPQITGSGKVYNCFNNDTFTILAI